VAKPKPGGKGEKVSEPRVMIAEAIRAYIKAAE
jgi:hypothetical protein